MALYKLTTTVESLEDARIVGLPASGFYISNFISAEEERFLLEKVETAPKGRWKYLSKRRLQTWPSDLLNNTLLGSPLPKWLIDPIYERILSYPVIPSKPDHHIFSDSPHQAPNHVLINEYLPGQGIMPHKDGGAYHPVVCTVSLGGSLCLDVYGTKEDGSREVKSKWRIFQEPRSLLITTGELYTDYMHGIDDTTKDVELSQSSVVNWNLLGDTSEIHEGESQRCIRTSLTYRDVLKVSKLGGKLCLFGMR